MGDAQRQLASRQQVHHDMVICFVSANKLDLTLHLSYAAHTILGYSALKVSEALWCIMEVRNRLMQGICRVVGKLVLKITKSYGALVKILGGLHLLQADGVLYKIIDAPAAAIGGPVIRLSSFGQHNMERGACRVIPTLFGLFAQKIRYAANVFHQTVRVLECISIDLLQDVALCPLRRRYHNGIRLIDMPFAIGNRL